MATLTRTVTKYAFLDANHPNSPSTGAAQQQAYYANRTTRLILGLSDVPSTYRYRGVGSSKLFLRAAINDDVYADGFAVSFSDFDPATVTYNTAPSTDGTDLLSGDGWLYGETTGSQPTKNVWGEFNPYGKLLDADHARAKCVWLTGIHPINSNYPRCEIFTPSSGSAPYMTVELSDENAHLEPSPSWYPSGYADPRTEILFSWINTVEYPSGFFSSLAEPAQTSCALLWRIAGSGSAFNRIAGAGNGQSITVPANTFPSRAEIEWQIEITDAGGTTTKTSARTFSTTAAESDATPAWPSGSVVNETVKNYFSWRCNRTLGADPSRAEAQWSSDGGSTWNDLTPVNGYFSFTVAANTFPVSSSLSWRVRAYNQDGVAGPWSTPASFSTVDTLPVAEPAAPIGTVEAGDGPIAFRWAVQNQSGAAQIRSQLQWAAQGGAWTDLATIDGALTQFEAPANTFAAGTILWRVRSVNRQQAAGPWSDAASFISVAAPAAPSVNTDAAPFATIIWQVEGQQAYRLTVDGKVYGPFFGTDKSFTLPDFLADGEHTAAVEVQGLYGLWSQPGSISFTVANTPGDALTLQGSFGTDAALTWQTQSQTADFLVYRDGVRIGHTAGGAFVDRLALGQHSYRVVNRLPDGNYTASNEISGRLRSCVTQIALAAGGDWLALRMSENQMNEEQFSFSRTYSLRHISGAEYPVLEMSPYLDGSGRYNAAFATLPEAQAFEALKGQVVILKSRGGNVVIGALTDLQKRNGEFYIAYEFTVQRCHWEDFVDDADG